jgi:hypothetical protein
MVNGTGYYPVGTGTAYSYPTATGTGALWSNNSCGGCTINVQGASAEYWFPATYVYAATTLVTVDNDALDGLVAATATDTLNITQTMLSYAYTPTQIVFPEYDLTLDDWAPYTITPSAVSTDVVYRSSYMPITGTIAVDDLTNYQTDPGDAITAITGPTSTVAYA